MINAAALTTRQRFISAVAVVATATMFGLTYSLSAALIALDLAERGFDESMIGLNAAMHAIGVLIVAPLLPRIVGHWGTKPLVMVALAMAAVVLALFPAAPFVWLWFPLRLLLGMASEVLFVLSETWINFLTTEKARAVDGGLYRGALAGFRPWPPDPVIHRHRNRDALLSGLRTGAAGISADRHSGSGDARA
jgi:MFS family permease